LNLRSVLTPLVRGGCGENNRQRDHVMRTEGFQELSDELLQEFKSNGA
jgi:hypothetical protein